LFKIATEQGFTRTVQLLLENGASIDMSNSNGRTALYYGKENYR
jgi:ankyrin repeat protein